MNLCVGICVYITKYTGNVCILLVILLISAVNAVTFVSVVRRGLYHSFILKDTPCEFVQYLRSNCPTFMWNRQLFIGVGYWLHLLELVFFHHLFFFLNKTLVPFWINWVSPHISYHSLNKSAVCVYFLLSIFALILHVTVSHMKSLIQYTYFDTYPTDKLVLFLNSYICFRLLDYMHGMNVISMHFSYLVASDIYDNLVCLKKLHDGLLEPQNFFLPKCPPHNLLKLLGYHQI
jgi:hypothetical protein